MQCTYIPETNYVPREYSVAAILLFLFMVLISLVPVLNLLYFYISTFRSMCAVLNMAVFCSSLTSCFPGMLLTYFPNDFEIVPVAPYYYWYHLCFYIPHALLLLLLLLLLYSNGRQAYFIFPYFFFNFFSVLSLHLVFQYIPKPFCSRSSHSSLSLRY